VPAVPKSIVNVKGAILVSVITAKLNGIPTRPVIWLALRGNL